jgi:hypothetical protein
MKEIDKGDIEIAKSLMKKIMYDNGAVDRWNPEKYPEKWVSKIAPIAGNFFEKNPELLTDENITVLACGSDSLVGFDGMENLEGFKELNDVLNDYFINGII